MQDSEPSLEERQKSRVLLRLLATSDVHGHLRAYDYYSDSPDPGRGLSLAATLAERLRSGADLCLLIDNGDFLQGTPLTELAARETPEAGAHPVVAAMAAMGYDAAALGNHEFDYGLGYLQDVLAEAPFPALCANVLREGGAPLAAPWTVLERELPAASGQGQPLRIGLLALAPPQIAQWSRRVLRRPLETRPIRDTAQRLVPEMRAAGADLVVVLCHSGIGTTRENAALDLAEIPGIDAIVVGHTHLVFPDPGRAAAGIDAEAGTLHHVPAVEPGSKATHLGVIDLGLAPRPGGGWRVTDHTARAVPVSEAGAVESPAVLAATEAAHRRTCEEIRRPLGETLVPLQSYFAQLGPCAPMRLMAEAKRAHAAPQLAAAGLEGLPVLVAVAPSRSGGRGGARNYIDIPAGPLIARHAAEFYPYPNRVCAVEASGAEVADWLERSATQFRRIAPGEPGQDLIDPAVPGFSCDMLDGVGYEIDVSAEARYDAEGTLIDEDNSRVRELTLEGRPVLAEDRFVIVTNSFRLGGGGNVRAATGKPDLIDGAVTRTVVEGFLGARSPLRPATGTRWRFAPLARPTGVLFDTGPGALAHLGEAPLPLRRAGETPEGFLRFGLTL